MKKLFCIVFLLILQHNISYCQPAKVNSKLFFLDDIPIEVTITTDIRKIKRDKKNLAWQPAHISMQFSDTSTIAEDIRMQPRGEYRKNNCDMASLMLNFKNPSSPLLSPLKKLKLVGDCKSGANYEEALLKEYLIYKILNFLSPMSFRVRLLHITYKDSEEKVKSFTQYAFLIEDEHSLVERNNCKEVKKTDLYTEETNREQMTFVSLFQYMIGNTDWSVYKCHNIKLMVSKNDTLSRPYAIPYDFDYSGFVNIGYAVPAEELGLESVRQRMYRGFARGYDELQAVIDVFKEKKESIFYYIDHFELCSTRCKKDMTSYLNQFYNIISNNKSVESIFIRDARTQ
ncbi:MAG: hypothetical protein M3015_07225 [Bacteroidota bacterium]|nr:hypothetical protein [Bacteroidota bacterium]